MPHPGPTVKADSTVGSLFTFHLHHILVFIWEAGRRVVGPWDCDVGLPTVPPLGSGGRLSHQENAFGNVAFSKNSRGVSPAASPRPSPGPFDVYLPSPTLPLAQLPLVAFV